VADIASRHCCSQRGIVHGKLKPTNILISENGQACVSDYGMVELKPSSGCARYFSPEAWKGVCISCLQCLHLLICVFFQTISRPSDVFAFGMSSYEVRLFVSGNCSHVQWLLDFHVDPAMGCTFGEPHLSARRSRKRSPRSAGTKNRAEIWSHGRHLGNHGGFLGQRGYTTPNFCSDSELMADVVL
jgi:serine/threonine protein kinase